MAMRSSYQIMRKVTAICENFFTGLNGSRPPARRNPDPPPPPLLRLAWGSNLFSLLRLTCVDVA
jgi:hypothetical protein